MILGNYWYYHFPKGLYPYHFFEFVKGLGGHADGPAEIRTCVKVTDPDQLLVSLQELVHAHRDASVMVFHLGPFIAIEVSDYHLFDFEFELCAKIEMMLQDHGATPCTREDLRGGKLIRMKHPDYIRVEFVPKKLFQVVSTDKAPFNAESISLRLDCLIFISAIEPFLEGLLAYAEHWNINTIYYISKEIGPRTNLMLFFSNGRQGVRLQPKQHVDIARIEKELQSLMDQHKVQHKHLSGQGIYPSGDRVTLLNREGGYYTDLEVSLHAEDGGQSDSGSQAEPGGTG